jgi:hypothetical protein
MCVFACNSCPKKHKLLQHVIVLSMSMILPPSIRVCMAGSLHSCIQVDMHIFAYAYTSTLVIAVTDRWFANLSTQTDMYTSIYARVCLHIHALTGAHAHANPRTRHKADVWGLGVIALEMCLCAAPFQGQHTATSHCNCGPHHCNYHGDQVYMRVCEVCVCVYICMHIYIYIYIYIYIHTHTHTHLITRMYEIAM